MDRAYVERELTRSYFKTQQKRVWAVSGPGLLTVRWKSCFVWIFCSFVFNLNGGEPWKACFAWNMEILC